MHLDVIINDPDRKLEFTLTLEGRYRAGTKPRRGWRDGGEPGDDPAFEIDRARCTDIVVWCGKSGVSALPGLAAGDRCESRLGDWCLQEYPDEIDRAVWDQVRERRPRIAV